MSKIRITTIKEGIKEEEIFSRLKAIGVKVKTPERGSETSEEKEKPTLEKKEIVEKRVASTIIRRRLRPTEKEVPSEEPKLEKPEEKILEKILKVEKKVEEKIEPPRKELKERIVFTEIEPEVREEEKKVEKITLEAEAIEEKEELKGESEVITEKEKKEITKALEEWYGQDLEREVILYDEEDRRRKKAEKLLKKIEEQEKEEEKVKKKPKRKVVVRDEEFYPTRKQRAKVLPIKKEKKEKEREPEKEKEEIRPLKKLIKIGNEIQVSELAKRMGIKANELLAKLISLGVMANVNQHIDFDTAYILASEYGCEVEKVLTIEEEFQAMEVEKKEEAENLKPRPPIVTIMGHVDHGKTLLLDTIRHTNVAQEEAGGITQHIGAYMVNVEGKEIVFIDTPGHEAFTAMRARGAQVTDIVVLVVAADDGVMPQTIEAIDHARAANVPIIVAINKIDKENANPDLVMKDLSNIGIIPEEWGGNVLFAKISAKKRVGIKELLELILLQADMMELKANPDKPAKGIVIESRLDKGQGPVGTVIIQEGTLKIQDPFICGTTFGRVRAMIDHQGKRIEKATPSMPVLVVGFQDLPQGGDKLVVTTEERYAKELSKYRLERLKEKEQAADSRMSLDKLYAKMEEKGKATLNLIVKGDARGTLDAINEALKKLATEKVDIHIIHSGVGAITETDINLAISTGGVILGFNTKPAGKAKILAEKEKVEIRTYSIIYDLIDDVKKAMEGLLEPVFTEKYIGKAEIRKVFSISKLGNVAGCCVTDGKVSRSAIVKVRRDGNVLFEGKIGSLKRFKDDVKEVAAGYECGIGIEDFSDIREGDILEFFLLEKEKQSLDEITS